MKKSLFDTDILSEILRRKNAPVMARYHRYQERRGRIAISSLTVFEVLQGLHKAERTEHIEWFARWLPRSRVIHFDLPCARVAGQIGGELKKVGRTIGVVDVGLAATAIHHKRVLVTGNTAHYNFVREAGFELELENWRDPVE